MMTETPSEESPIDADYRDPAIDGCPHCRDPRSCEDCASFSRSLAYVRALADGLAAAANEAMEPLKRLVSLLADLADQDANWTYAEFYRDFAADNDALADLMDAQRALRSFTRIAEQRALRTKREP